MTHLKKYLLVWPPPQANPWNLGYEVLNVCFYTLRCILIDPPLKTISRPHSCAALVSLQEKDVAQMTGGWSADSLHLSTPSRSGLADDPTSPEVTSSQGGLNLDPERGRSNKARPFQPNACQLWRATFAPELPTAVAKALSGLLCILTSSTPIPALPRSFLKCWFQINNLYRHLHLSICF